MHTKTDANNFLKIGFRGKLFWYGSNLKAQTPKNKRHILSNPCIWQPNDKIFCKIASITFLLILFDHPPQNPNTHSSKCMSNYLRIIILAMATSLLSYEMQYPTIYL